MSATSVDADKVATAPAVGIDGPVQLPIIECAVCGTSYFYALRYVAGRGNEFMPTSNCRHKHDFKVREKS